MLMRYNPVLVFRKSTAGQMISIVFLIKCFLFTICVCTVCVLILQISSLHYTPWKLRYADQSFPWKPVKVAEVDCSRLIAGDQAEITLAYDIQRKSRGVLSDDHVTQLATQCAELLREKSFITSSLTEEEKDFPIAFSLIVYKEAGQVLNLLSTIYRPQNVYCIHVDAKAKEGFLLAMTAVANCLPNVFVSSRSVTIRWGRFTVLESELICMQDLWNHTQHWKYFINLTGQEFPLKTNLELVRILQVYNGSNDVIFNWPWKHAGRWAKRGTPPHGIKIRKGSVHVVLNRDFVDYILHSDVARDFLEWCNGTGVPDETFFPTLNYNPQFGIRGSYNGSLQKTRNVVRFKNWGGPPCASGMFVRGICILSVGDLPLLDGRPELFANKFFVGYSRFALECLAERLYNRTRDEYLGYMDINVSFYRTLPFVTNSVRTTVD